MNEDIKYRFFITTQAGERELFPNNLNNLNISWTKDQNSAFFRKQLTGKIKIVGEDFKYLLAQENSIYRCNQMPFIINKNCNGFSEYFIGQMLCDDGTWNLSICEVEIQATIVDVYACLDGNKSTEINLFGVTAHDEHVNTLRGTIEKVTYRTTDYPPVDWGGGGGDPIAQGWIIVYKTETHDVTAIPPSVDQAVTWARETVNVDFPLGEPWILISATPDGPVTHYVYVRQPAIFGMTTSRTQDSDTEYTTVTQWKYGAMFQNGMKLYDALAGFLFSICPDLTIKSDFFQWNPDNVSTVNYETGEDSKVLNLILFQKSDVKRPPTQSDIDAGFAADDAATIANTTFDDLLQDILTTFKLQFWIDEDHNLRIEHPSYFNKVLGLDLTLARDDSKFRAGSAVYSYVTDGLPKRERFSWMDEASPGDFAGQDIVYESTCSGISEANDKDVTVKNITTDVELCLDNPEEDSIVSDDGFVLMACDADNFLLYELPILGGHTLNNSLSWAYLQYDYFRYNNYFKDFILNNNEEQTQKLLPNKKQSGVIAVICCGEEFDPDKLVKTVIGTGEVSSAILNLFTDQLTLEILFEQNKDLIANAVPVALNGNVRTPVNEAIIIDVLAGATDSDGAIVPGTLLITSAPIHGIAVVTGDFKIEYTPDADYIGSDSFDWTVEDDFSQPSNVATESIVVYQPAIAVDDSFKIAKNKILNRIAYNLLTNDTGTAPLSCVAETKATTHGNVIINADGTFKYTPNAGYIGDDTFPYTLKDVNNDTDIGTVTIHVFDPVPVFVRLVKGADVFETVEFVCENPPPGLHVVGHQTTNLYNAYYYSDAGGTVPLDVTGYETLLHFNNHRVDNGVPSDAADTRVLFDLSQYLGNIVTDYVDHGCSGLSNYQYTQVLTLIASADYTII